jgi:hypothetical protein
MGHKVNGANHALQDCRQLSAHACPETFESGSFTLSGLRSRTPKPAHFGAPDQESYSLFHNRAVLGSGAPQPAEALGTSRGARGLLYGLQPCCCQHRMEVWRQRCFDSELLAGGWML